MGEASLQSLSFESDLLWMARFGGRRPWISTRNSNPIRALMQLSAQNVATALGDKRAMQPIHGLGLFQQLKLAKHC